ncbi:MAG TPA: UDP-N-acetylmuramoyl-L-alanine--D-glutamate ligase [Candidatus Dormibacteraeota bacterium]|nr:UDP-N-acetylmuramoyl-L-alanine--D-glutamate ligase [Candidatus Dormibacteraeota bacterium]
MTFDSTNDFSNGQRVLVIGLGRSGLATVEVLRARGAEVWAIDDKPAELIEPAIREIEAAGATFLHRDELEPLVSGFGAAVVSPGVPLTTPTVRRVQDAGIPVYSEIEVAYRICRAPILAVTGTKGKTTTTALLGAMLAADGRTVHVGGNIGNALIRETAKAAPEDWVVAEVSSFQLESIRSFKPRVSLILNLSPDHLDRYHSMEEYREAKLRIFANQGPGDIFVGNLDDPYFEPLSTDVESYRIPCQAWWFSRHPHRNSTLYARDGKIYFARPGAPRAQAVMPIDEIPLLGEHNVINVMGAAAAALAAGVPIAAIREAVKRFQALPHRLQTVGEIDGVRYVDDSKGTNPGAVIAALKSFDHRRVVAICGGKAKGTDFSEMGDELDERARAVVLIGEAADAIATHVVRAAIHRADTMEEAVDVARGLAQPGDVVLLSPGCASFDMFESAEHRGQVFTAAVHALAERGAPRGA